MLSQRAHEKKKKFSFRVWMRAGLSDIPDLVWNFSPPTVRKQPVGFKRMKLSMIRWHQH